MLPHLAIEFTFVKENSVRLFEEWQGLTKPWKTFCFKLDLRAQCCLLTCYHDSCNENSGGLQSAERRNSSFYERTAGVEMGVRDWAVWVFM